jgi:hypothetical protein
MTPTVSDHVGAGHRLDDKKIMFSSIHQPYSEKAVDFEEEWNKLVHLVNLVTGREELRCAADKAWTHHFLPAISTAYENEEEFSVALLAALRSSLGEFCRTPMTDAHEIRLKHCNVGFATAKVYRHKSLGFKKNYSVAPDSNDAHGCIVFGGNVLDVIAAVELKLSSSSCMVFDRSDSRPELAYKHAALGQALMCTMDTLE